MRKAIGRPPFELIPNGSISFDDDVIVSNIDGGNAILSPSPCIDVALKDHPFDSGFMFVNSDVVDDVDIVVCGCCLSVTNGIPTLATPNRII